MGDKLEKHVSILLQHYTRVFHSFKDKNGFHLCLFDTHLNSNESGITVHLRFENKITNVFREKVFSVENEVDFREVYDQIIVWAQEMRVVWDK